MKTLTILMLLGLSPLLIEAQSYSVRGKGDLKVTGTSTLHDWEMKAQEVSGSAQFVLDGKAIDGLNSLSFSVSSESLKSEKSAMDKNAYKALKTDKFSTISFKLTRVTEIKPSGSAFKITAEGNLQIAGQTKPVQLTALCTPLENGTIECKGEKEINMTEFNVEPPSFMFGSVKTGEVVKVIFNLSFVNENQSTKK